ncbi:MAG: GNAT family protein [Candidatus Saccharibacteria bacterium]
MRKMFIKELICSDEIKLVKPDAERDVPLSIKWLNNTDGIKTLLLMGNAVQDDYKTNKKEESNRIKDFVSKKDQLNWMIEYKGKVIGAVWADLALKNGLKSPSVHIMIGDESARGRGIGTIAELTVIDYLFEQNYKTVYSRALTDNKRMIHIAINKLGFKKDEKVYMGEDGLIWQNLKMDKP